MAVKVRQKNGKSGLVVVALLALAGCAAPRPHPEPVAQVARAALPPHVIEVAQGLYSCERGYVIKQGLCIPSEELEHGPVVEISSLPAAGDGAPGTCPSGGCGSSYWSAPFYSTFVYSGAGQYGYYGAGSPWLSNGRICAPRARRFHGDELAFSGTFGSFVRERRFATAEFLGSRLRFQSSPERRFQAGGRFRANGTRRWR